MGEDRRAWVQGAALTLLGLMWLVRGLTNGDFAASVIGSSLVLGAASLALTNYAVGDSRVKRYTEAALLAASLGIVILGCFLSGAPILTVFTALIVALLMLSLALSCLLPRLRRP